MEFTTKDPNVIIRTPGAWNATIPPGYEPSKNPLYTMFLRNEILNKMGSGETYVPLKGGDGQLNMDGGRYMTTLPAGTIMPMSTSSASYYSDLAIPGIPLSKKDRRRMGLHRGDTVPVHTGSLPGIDGKVPLAIGMPFGAALSDRDIYTPDPWEKDYDKKVVVSIDGKPMGIVNTANNPLPANFVMPHFGVGVRPVSVGAPRIATMHPMLPTLSSGERGPNIIPALGVSSMLPPTTLLEGMAFPSAFSTDFDRVGILIFGRKGDISSFLDSNILLHSVTTEKGNIKNDIIYGKVNRNEDINPKTKRFDTKISAQRILMEKTNGKILLDPDIFDTKMKLPSGKEIFRFFDLPEFRMRVYVINLDNSELEAILSSASTLSSLTSTLASSSGSSFGSSSSSVVSLEDFSTVFKTPFTPILNTVGNIALKCKTTIPSCNLGNLINELIPKIMAVDVSKKDLDTLFNYLTYASNDAKVIDFTPAGYPNKYYITLKPSVNPTPENYATPVNNFIKYKRGEITELETKDGQLFIGPTVKKSSSTTFGLPIGIGYGPALGYAAAPRGLFGWVGRLFGGGSREETQPTPAPKPINPQEIVNMFK